MVKERLIPCAKKQNRAICKPWSADDKNIYKEKGKVFCVMKVIRGKRCRFARGAHLTLEKARLLAGKVGELSDTTIDKTEIMKGLIPFAKEHNIALCTPRPPRSAENKCVAICGSDGGCGSGLEARCR